ncbi:MAG: M23 family metallopeptidase [Bdellovibrionales bacterium]|nr:M23 family metallopeptidase [Bdellovibrionales bacterium]
MRFPALIPVASLLVFSLTGCGILPLRPSRGTDVGGLIRRAEEVEAPDDPALDAAPWSFPDLPPHLRRACLAWPLPVNRVSSSYGQRFGRSHQGLDLRALTGTPVRSVLAGLVVAAGSPVRGYGKIVLVKHARGLFTLYAHLSRIDVEPGQPVARAQVIGASGATGRVTGPHLHFEIRDGEVAIDPLRILPGAAAFRRGDPCPIPPGPEAP